MQRTESQLKGWLNQTQRSNSIQYWYFTWNLHQTQTDVSIQKQPRFAVFTLQPCFKSKVSPWATDNFLFHSIIWLKKLSGGFRLKCSFPHIQQAAMSLLAECWRWHLRTVCVRVLQVSQRGQQTSKRMTKGRITEVVSSALSGRIHMEIRPLFPWQPHFYQLFLSHWSLRSSYSRLLFSLFQLV